MLYAIVYHGIPGVLFTKLVSAIVMTFCSMFVVRHLIGISIGSQLFYPWRPVASSLIMAAFLYLSEPWLELSRGPILAIRLSAVVAASVAIYAIANWLLWLVAGKPQGIESRIATSAAAMLRRLR
jgi:hypothetical protein